MARIEVFPFTVWDNLAGATVTRTLLSTRDFIDRANGQPVLAKMRMVDDSLLDGNGRVVLDPTTPSAKYLKELDAEGEGTAPSQLNRKAMDALAIARLVTATVTGPGRTTYRITDRGRQYVRDLLS